MLWEPATHTHAAMKRKKYCSNSPKKKIIHTYMMPTCSGSSSLGLASLCPREEPGCIQRRTRMYTTAHQGTEKTRHSSWVTKKNSVLQVLRTQWEVLLLQDSKSTLLPKLPNRKLRYKCFQVTHIHPGSSWLPICAGFWVGISS